MVEVIKIQADNKKTKKNKSGVFVLLGIFILYMIAVVTAVAIIGTYKNKEKIGTTGNNGYQGSYYYVEIAFYDLDVGKENFEIKASDFTIETMGREVKAISFEGGAKTHTISKKKEIEYVKVMFARSSDFGFYIGDIEYKDEEIEPINNKSIGKMLVPVISFETFFFVIIFFLALVIIKNTDSSKPFKQKCREVNEGVIRVLKEKGFKSTKVFYMASPKTGENNIEKMILCVDKNNNKLALVDYQSKECVIANYNDVVSFKVNENNGVQTKQVTGTTIFNLPYTETETYDVCNKLQLIIVLDDENKTNVVYEFVKSGIRTNSNTYKDIQRIVTDVSSTLELITSGASSRENKLFIRCKYCGVKNKVDASHCCSCGAVLD